MFVRKVLVAPLTRRAVWQRMGAFVPGTATTDLPVAPAQATLQQLRSKHGAKKGQHVKNIQNRAHDNEHQQAVERRKKKKAKEEVRGLKDKHNTDDDDEFVQLPEVKEVQALLKDHLDGFKDVIKGIRGNEATADMFDEVQVADAYGKGTGSVPLNSLAQVVLQQPTLAVATCYDPSTTKAVAKAIQQTLELNPQTVDESGTLQIPIPRASQESRQQAAGLLHDHAEQFKVRIRNTRRDVLDVVKEATQGRVEGISKDDAFRRQKEIENIVNQCSDELSQLAQQKHDEIMQV